MNNINIPSTTFEVFDTLQNFLEIRKKFVSERKKVYEFVKNAQTNNITQQEIEDFFPIAYGVLIVCEEYGNYEKFIQNNLGNVNLIKSSLFSNEETEIIDIDRKACDFMNIFSKKIQARRHLDRLMSINFKNPVELDTLTEQQKQDIVIDACHIVKQSNNIKIITDKLKNFDFKINKVSSPVISSQRLENITHISDLRISPDLTCFERYIRDDNSENSRKRVSFQPPKAKIIKNNYNNQLH